MKSKLIGVLAAFALMSAIQISPARADTISKSVNVFAASSLTKAYTALGAKFMQAHPNISVKFSFGASSTLATQIASGAPADIFASADPVSMKTAAAQFPIAANYLQNLVVLAVPKDSTISKFTDLNGKATWLQCGHNVPCGVAADAALKSEGVVMSSPVSLEPTASAALAKLLAGAVDAAIIFKTDVIANSTKLKSIAFSNPESALSQYQIGLSNAKTSKKNVWAKTFYAYLNGHDAKKFLAASGFIVNPYKIPQ